MYIIDRINGVLAWISATLIGVLMLGISWSVIWRYTFNSPIGWSVEISEYSLLFITFLSSAWLLRKEGHVNVEVVVAVLSSRYQTLFRVIRSILGVLVCSVLVWYGAATALKYFVKGLSVMGSLKFPAFILISIIPIGCLLLLIEFVRDTLASLEKWKELSREERDRRED